MLSGLWERTATRKAIETATANEGEAVDAKDRAQSADLYRLGVSTPMATARILLSEEEDLQSTYTLKLKSSSR